MVEWEELQKLAVAPRRISKPKRGRLNRYSCNGKNSYKTKKEADVSIRWINRKGYSESGRRLNSYKCEGCHSWHIGNILRNGKVENER